MVICVNVRNTLFFVADFTDAYLPAKIVNAVAVNCKSMSVERYYILTGQYSQ